MKTFLVYIVLLGQFLINSAKDRIFTGEWRKGDVGTERLRDKKLVKNKNFLYLAITPSLPPSLKFRWTKKRKRQK